MSRRCITAGFRAASTLPVCHALPHHGFAMHRNSQTQARARTDPRLAKEVKKKKKEKKTTGEESFEDGRHQRWLTSCLTFLFYVYWLSDWFTFISSSTMCEKRILKKKIYSLARRGRFGGKRIIRFAEKFPSRWMKAVNASLELSFPQRIYHSEIRVQWVFFFAKVIV